jgi:uncharacterized protein (DUF169 family)
MFGGSMNAIRIKFSHNNMEAYVCTFGLIFANEKVTVDCGVVRKAREGEHIFGTAMENSYPSGCLVVGREKVK